MVLCAHDLLPILCEACADAEVAKHKQFWHAGIKSMEYRMNEQPVFRVVEGVLQRAEQWVEVGIGDLEAQAEASLKALEDATASNARIQGALLAARAKLTAAGATVTPTAEASATVGDQAAAPTPDVPAAPAVPEPPLPASATDAPADAPAEPAPLGALPPDQRPAL